MLKNLKLIYGFHKPKPKLTSLIFFVSSTIVSIGAWLSIALILSMACTRLLGLQIGVINPLLLIIQERLNVKERLNWERHCRSNIYNGRRQRDLAVRIWNLFEIRGNIRGGSEPSSEASRGEERSTLSEKEEHAFNING